jgi:luciferase family oxidoreductase group 1
MAILSVLDLSPILEGSDAGQSLNNSRDLAQQVERMGYHRYWLAEHHNMPGIASSATAVAIGHVAGGTKTIRVGAGGIMLPNHAPLVIAEQFGTLESLYPGRIDLGLGRAPGTDQRTAYALRRTLSGDVNDFPRDVIELQNYFGSGEGSERGITAVPGAGLGVPIWILGSSLYGAQLAGMLGLPYAFASHFAPDALMDALDMYRREFKPSEQLDKPYVMAGFNVFAAPTDEEAHFLRTSARKATLSMRMGRPRALPLPDADFEQSLGPSEKRMLDHQGSCSAVGAPETVAAQLRDFVDRTGVDELMIAAQIYDHSKRVQSFEIAMSAWKDVG